MKLSQPFKRIIRPFSLPDAYINGNISRAHLTDTSYATDRYEAIRAYHILEKDLTNLFEFIEPSDTNLDTYSFRIYELFLRASTEFELNAKKILEANEYGKIKNLNINDYYKIDAATRLSEYRLFISVWADGRKEILPFSDWSNGHTLTWYQDYNLVKHNRHKHFSKASFANLLNAIAAVFSIVFAQFHMLTFNQYQITPMYNYDEETLENSSEKSLFSLILPQTWPESEMYDFDWETLKHTQEPYKNYPF